MIRDRMGNIFASEKQIPDYGTLFLIKEREDGINDYGGSDVEDAKKLKYITNAAIGSTCLFTDGSLYRKDYLGWFKMGEEPAEITGNSATKVTEIMEKTVTELVNTTATTIPTGFFKNCTNLTSIDLPAVTTIGEQAFMGCTGLTKIEFPAATAIEAQAFKDCSNLETVVLPGEFCAMNSGDCWSRTKLSSTGKIYVKDALVDTYKGATNWSGYSGKIFAISEMETE